MTTKRKQQTRRRTPRRLTTRVRRERMVTATLNGLSRKKWPLGQLADDVIEAIGAVEELEDTLAKRQHSPLRGKLQRQLQQASADLRQALVQARRVRVVMTE